MHQHIQICQEELCLESKLFNSGLSQKNGILNNCEENLKKCADFLIYLKKKLLSQVNSVCLESLNSVFISQMKIYAEKTQFCQKFIQMIGLVHKVNPELTTRGLKVFYDDIKKQFILEERQLFDGSYVLSQLRAFSMVLEGVKKFGDLIEAEKSFLFGSLISMLSYDLLRGTTVIEKQTVYYIMKIILQLLQHKGLTMTTTTTTLVEPGGEAYWKCFCISMAVLKTEDCTKDSQLIAASVVVELLKLVDDDLKWLEMVYICFCYLLGCLTLNGRLSMGSTVLCGALLAHSDIRKLTIALVNLNYSQSKLGFEPGTPNMELPKIFNFKVFVDSLDYRAEIEGLSTKALHLFIFEVAISSCRSSSHLHYQSLKLLQQWCQLLPSLYAHFTLRSAMKGMRDEVMSMITMHVESQIDGVDRNAVDVLSSLLEAFRKISSRDAEFHEQFESFKSGLYSQVLSFNWNIRSKYLLLGPLLDHVAPDLALDALMLDLRKCLSTNHLVPCSTNIYRKIVSVFKSSPGCLNLWTNHCCPHLINALTNSKSLERKNAAHYWLPNTLHIIPESLESMTFCLDHLESPKEPSSIPSLSSSSSSVPKEWMDVLNFLSTDVSTSSIVYARLRILWAARMAALKYDCPSKDLKFAFSSSSNDLRLAALNLICTSPSTTDCLSEKDVSMLKQFMAFQLSADDPAFRKELEKCLRSICVRCRDYALMKIRAQRKNEKRPGNGDADDKNVRLCLELMDFLWQTCKNNISPNSNFQRLSSALAWMRIILGTFTSAPRQIRKGVVPVDVHLFLEAARERHLCDFFTESCTTSLLCCIFNEVDQISEMSSEILQIYFPWPLKCEGLITLDGRRITEKECIGLRESVSVSHNDVDTSLWLLKESLELCDNIRSRESSCGVVLGGLLFSRCIVEQQTAMKLCRLKDNKIVSSRISEVPSQLSRMSCGLLFVEQLFDVLVDDFNQATSDIVNKAASLPLHGLMSLMTKCFKRLPMIEPDDGENEEKMKKLVCRITNFCKDLVDSILDIFGGRLLNEVTCLYSPSFEQISRAISELIEASKGGSDGKEGQMKTSDEEATRLHQFVSSWCWLNMKECGLLLGELMRYSERNGRPTFGMEDSEQVGQVFFKILTQCRHRGAIESCTAGLLDFCSASFHSSDKLIFNLPARLVDQVFDQLEALSDSSTTRRSAGLPSIVQTVLISEARCGQSIIMKRVIGRLLELCGTPQNDFHEQRDHPQVHATNILNTLVHESCLSDAMAQFLEPIVLSVLDGFNSDNWMIRNAALQLFGSMVPRMVGEKTSSDETTRATNSSEFLLRFPKLFQSVLDILIKETQNMKNSSNGFVDFCEKFLNPLNYNSPSEARSPSHSLVPILSLLSRLAPSYHLSKKRSSQELSLCYLVQNLCQSSILMVRDLSSKVLLSFVSGENLFELLVSMVMLLPEACAYLSTNRVHGLLLQLLKLHVAAAHCLNDEQLYSVRSLLKTKSHLLSSSCLLIRACFLKVMLLWDVQSHLVLENLESIFPRDELNGSEVGLAFYQQTLVNVWLSETHDQCLLMKNIASCLKSTYSEIVQSCLDWILNFEGKFSIGSKANIVSSLWDLLDSNQPWFILCSALKALLKLCSRYSQETLDSFNKAWMLLDSICKATIHVIDDENFSCRTAKSYTPSTLALELLSQIFSKALELRLLSDSEMMEKVLEWSGMVLWCSRCTKNVDLRRSAVKSCRDIVPICFKIFIEQHHNHLSSDWSVFFIRLLEAGLTFLTDDDAEIRSSAAKMISLVSKGKSSDTSLPSSIHHEIAIRVWLEVILNVTCTDHMVVHFLFKLIEENEAYSKLKSFQKNKFELDDIFQAEDDNPYFEADQFHKIISICLLEKNPIPSKAFVEDKILSLLSRIAMVMIISSPENRSLGVAFNKKLSSCLSSLCWQHLLLKNFLANIDAEENLDSAKSSLADAEKEIELLRAAIFSLGKKL